MARRDHAAEYQRRLDIAEVGGFDSLREYQAARQGDKAQQMIEIGNAERGEYVAQIVGLAEGTLIQDFETGDWADFIQELLAHGVNVQEFLDALYDDA